MPPPRRSRLFAGSDVRLGRPRVDGDGATLFDLDLGDSMYSYPALTADDALIVGSGNGPLVASG